MIYEKCNSGMLQRAWLAIQCEDRVETFVIGEGVRAFARSKTLIPITRFSAYFRNCY